MNPYFTAVQALALAICLMMLSTVGEPALGIVLCSVFLGLAVLARFMDWEPIKPIADRCHLWHTRHPWRGEHPWRFLLEEYLLPLDAPLWAALLLWATLSADKLPFVGGLSVAHADEPTAKALLSGGHDPRRLLPHACRPRRCARDQPDGRCRRLP